MIERLDKLCFLPPPSDTPWSTSPTERTRCEINREDGQRVAIDVPLFWYDPPWYQLSTDTADVIAVAIGQQGVLVSALRSDLSGPDQQPEFHDVDSDQEQENSEPLARIVPYRPERYGVSDQDFDGARIIDLRLMMNRDPSGRFAFPPEQVERWEATLPSAPLAGGSWVPSATFPPDVVSMQHLSSKLRQLRTLSPTAAVFVSLGPYRLDEELPEIVAAKPDGLIVRLDELELDGLKLALATRHARQLADRAGATDLPLWIVPGEITPDDAVKLLTLGASGVAIDSWCAEIVEAAINESPSSGARRYSSRRSNDENLIELVEDRLTTRVERFKGLFNSIQYLPPDQRLGSSSETWARALDVRSLSLSSVSAHASAKSRGAVTRP